MADNRKKDEGVLVSAAKAIGAVAGKIAAVAGAHGSAVEAVHKENEYQAEYLGSGTFIIHKPKRKNAKLRQSRLKGPRRGSRK
jgi:NADPH-dependent curcumin reductase CurA